MATIRKQGKNSYLIRVSCGYNDKGKQIVKQKTWRVPSGVSKFEERRLLSETAADFESRVLSGDYTKPITFEELSKQWFEVMERELKHSTLSVDKTYCKQTCEEFGYMRVDKITAAYLQGYVNKLAKAYAPTSIKAKFAFISDIMGYAYKLGMVKENPCRRVTLPKKLQKEKKILTITEMKRFLDYVTANLPLMQQVFFLLAIFCGLRRGEIIGLQWDDIDFEQSQLKIRRTAYFSKDRGTYTDTPKTKKSRRTVAIPQSVLDVLKQYTQVCLSGEWLFTIDGKHVLATNTPSYWTANACKKAGVKAVTPHSFRHFYASLLIGEGEDVSTVSASLGHSAVSTTLDIYTHAFEDKKRAANMKVEEILMHRTEYIDLESIFAVKEK